MHSIATGNNEQHDVLSSFFGDVNDQVRISLGPLEGNNILREFTCITQVGNQSLKHLDTGDSQQCCCDLDQIEKSKRGLEAHRLFFFCKSD